jgi:periplasmic mercuric ion binding protein
MKTKVLSLVSMLLLGTSAASAQPKTEKFEVKGICAMCKNRIEKAAKSVNGVSTANWSQETKMLEVSFNKSKTSVKDIQMAIAKVSHDTPMHKAKDEVYISLPGCCKYDRTEVKKERHGHEGQMH